MPMDAHSTSSLFAYGSLIFSEVWSKIVGSNREFTKAPAQLYGYTALRVSGQSYPGLIPAPVEDFTQGVLITGLTLGDWDILDKFEGSFYKRIEVEIELDEKRLCCAQTYLVCDHLRFKLTSEIWSADRFAANHLTDFLDRFVS